MTGPESENAPSPQDGAKPYNDFEAPPLNSNVLAIQHCFSSSEWAFLTTQASFRDALEEAETVFDKIRILQFGIDLVNRARSC